VVSPGEPQRRRDVSDHVQLGEATHMIGVDEFRVRDVEDGPVAVPFAHALNRVEGLADRSVSGGVQLHVQAT
jgi:hypothetical protein